MAKKLIVSTELSGVLGKPADWEQFYGFLWQDPAWQEIDFQGFEVIGWDVPPLNNVEDLLEEAGKKNIKIAGIHGRLGWKNKGVLIKIINSTLIPTASLVSKYGPQVGYILIHLAELQGKGIKELLLKNSSDINLLMIENHINAQALDEAVREAVLLNQAGLKAGVMFDLMHFILALNKKDDFEAKWRKTLEKLEWFLAQKDLIYKGLHIPVGTEEGDSLPVSKMNTSHWQSLAKVLKDQEVIKVVENSQSGNPFYVFPYKRKKMVERNKQVLQMLKDNGVI